MSTRCPVGHEVSDDAVYCPVCGTHVAGVSSLPRGIGRLIPVGLPLLLLAIMIGGGLLLATIVSNGGSGNSDALTVHPIGGTTGSAATGPSTPAAPAANQPGFTLPAGATTCPSTGSGPYDGVAAGAGTSCDFAGAAHAAYGAQGGNGAAITLQQVTDPTTHKWYTTRCTGSVPVTCTAIDGQVVYLGSAH